jgi:hypothetical protein
MSLRRSADRKVANLVATNGKTPKIANSFGLPAGQGCCKVRIVGLTCDDGKHQPG